MSDAPTQPVHEAFDQWALVEVMGHQQYAGRVSEITIAGDGFLRVDVPANGEVAAFCKILSPKSIYGLTPLDEKAARVLAANLERRPVPIYGVDAIRDEVRREMAIEQAQLTDETERRTTKEYSYEKREYL